MLTVHHCIAAPQRQGSQSWSGKRSATPKTCGKHPPGQQLAALVVPLHRLGAAALQRMSNVCTPRQPSRAAG